MLFSVDTFSFKKGIWKVNYLKSLLSDKIVEDFYVTVM